MARVWTSLGLLVGLVGCASDVDLCGGGSVCGEDGTTYADYCAAGNAGVAVAHPGPCVDECEGEPCPPRDAGRDADTRDGGSRDGGRVDASRLDGGRALDARILEAGADAGVCPGDLALCDDACVLLGSVANCTDCGDVCDGVPPGDSSGTNVCTASGCVVECKEGFGDCDDDPNNPCQSLRTQLHCGSCGDTCRGGSCTDGSCRCPPERSALCDGVCVDTDTNATHCGDCNHPCDPGQACVAGICEAAEGDINCTNPADWDCMLTRTGCVASCNGREFRVEGGVASCDGTDRVCVPPVVGGLPRPCRACIMEARICCSD